VPRKTILGPSSSSESKRLDVVEKGRDPLKPQAGYFTSEGVSGALHGSGKSPPRPRPKGGGSGCTSLMQLDCHGRRRTPESRTPGKKNKCGEQGGPGRHGVTGPRPKKLRPGRITSGRRVRATAGESARESANDADQCEKHHGDLELADRRCVRVPER